MKALPRLTALIALSALASPSLAQGPSQSEWWAAKIGTYLEAHHAHREFHGTALVAEHGEIVYQGTFGIANADWGIKNRLDTKFQLASITKQFTAMLTLLLVKDGKIELDAPIVRYLPGYTPDYGDKVTIHHLLNHTSGIPSYTDRPGFMRRDGKHHLPVTEFVAEYCSDPLEFEPGERFHYNNSGYYLLGAIIEAVTGKTYRAALREHILDPLEMHDTGVDDQYRVLPNRATGYDELLGERHISLWFEMSGAYSAGAMYSTASDLWKWDQALSSQRLLNGELEKRMYTAGAGDYGYGWFIGRRESDEPKVWHTGGMPGVSTMISRVSKRGRCIILLCNSSGAEINQATMGIEEILDGSTPRAPTPRPERALARTILDLGVGAGLERFAELPQRVRADEIEPAINGMGYMLLGRQRPNDALLLFEFNTRAFPDTANTWDSLGEAHKQVGNSALAIESYRKALELDPDSSTAPGMLEELEQAKTPQSPPDPAKEASSMASFTRMMPGHWQVTFESGTSMFETWTWGPGNHSARAEIHGSDAGDGPWRGLQTFYWHPGHKEVRSLGLSPYSRGVSEGTMRFDGETAEGTYDLNQIGIQRKMGVRWKFNGADKFRDTMLEDRGDGFSTLNELDYVRTENPAERRSDPADEEPKPSKHLAALEALAGHTWKPKNALGSADGMQIQTHCEWVPHVDYVYARTMTLGEKGESTHLFDTYVFHHTGLDQLRCLALSHNGAVYEGEVNVLDDGGLEIKLDGFAGDRVTPLVLRLDAAADSETETQHLRAWSLDGSERTLLLDAQHVRV